MLRATARLFKAVTRARDTRCAAADPRVGPCWKGDTDSARASTGDWAVVTFIDSDRLLVTFIDSDRLRVRSL